jgi:diguanylate cyclase (GGDEF)-like protein
MERTLTLRGALDAPGRAFSDRPSAPMTRRMTATAPAGTDEPDPGLELRVQSIAAGVWITLLVCLALGVWIAATWSQPHRAAMCVLAVLAATSAGGVTLLPARRIATGPYREAFFITWSLLDVGLILALAGFDGGVSSPAVLLLFLTLIFSALSYPLASMALVAVVSVLGVTALGLLARADSVDAADPAYLFMLVITLAMTGVMCVWQSRLHDRRNHELAILSRSDPLTGCLNRRGFATELGGALAAGRALTLIHLDLNDFKRVNDRLGHAAGDELLRWCVDVITGVVRPSDAVGRLGGDEFAVLLPGIPAAEGGEVARRIVSALAERIGCAAGVAGAPDDGRDPDGLHRAADQRLYLAKPAATVGDGRSSVDAGTSR